MTDVSRLRLAVPAVLLLAGDAALTLAGQPAAFWAGDRAAAVEANPVAAVFLRRGPAAFAGFAAASALAVVSAVALLPARLAPAFAAVVAYAHAVGGAAWLMRVGAPAAVLYLLGAVALVRRGAPSEEAGRGG